MGWFVSWSVAAVVVHGSEYRLVVVVAVAVVMVCGAWWLAMVVEMVPM
jgi:hypothetical protein